MTAPGLANARVLVVGGAGFVGSNLVRRLLAEGAARITVVDNFLSADAANVPDDARVHLIRGSIADDAVLAALPDDLDFAWHLACYHGNQSSIADPLADHANNTITSLKLFNRLKDLPALRKVVYAAAGCAVAEKTYEEAVATSEDAPASLFQDSPYSISKLVGEMYGNYFFARHQLPFVKARFQNVYGPGEILGAGDWRGTPHTVWRNVTPSFIFRALHGEALPLDNAGETSRDFIYVDDIVRGLIACALLGEPGEAYNLATGREVTIRMLADLINRETGNAAAHDLKPARDWDKSGRRYGDPTKSRDRLGFETQVPLAEGVARTVAWTRENLAVIKACLNRHSGRMDLRAYLKA
ncbi:MAG: NAD-dependent epimerase/dehydratase family protein [Hyphomonas sp.]|uniref:NAD-dependent epimerase/dehydratase family protein n=1 Tax=Hyphomonas sp. TaxID=87 RepID=UPI001815EBA5|nr:NAD-dependent epimerase/dehydratase family protein [Hyphomonas sp.]MBU3919882.1 NAD-dependent epimerase/dehydratase family protein [Alphaproteobacteria bacterium]MBA3067814.1 NAD-dependent epimerase/dehydratase family protein [Hyphomonas sp.]MBU4063900.1 NAD-dependent epimerase/dehydratase family protein [Alphaproteobacteria bacterium]MBU4163302.1 NAD-dependent epimerase/dehydratase family protein [Alphaproteobacteria bacterium]MBU4568416.1 NAD-dependent epimerase/dehydratase family protein